jgi:hypothetical protein
MEAGLYADMKRIFTLGRMVRNSSARSRPVMTGITISVRSRWSGPLRVRAIRMASRRVARAQHRAPDHPDMSPAGEHLGFVVHDEYGLSGL